MDQRELRRRQRRRQRRNRAIALTICLAAVLGLLLYAAWFLLKPSDEAEREGLAPTETGQERQTEKQKQRPRRSFPLCRDWKRP